MIYLSRGSLRWRYSHESSLHTVGQSCAVHVCSAFLYAHIPNRTRVVYGTCTFFVSTRTVVVLRTASLLDPTRPHVYSVHTSEWQGRPRVSVFRALEDPLPFPSFQQHLRFPKWRIEVCAYANPVQDAFRSGYQANDGLTVPLPFSSSFLFPALSFSRPPMPYLFDAPASTSAVLNSV